MLQPLRCMEQGVLMVLFWSQQKRVKKEKQKYPLDMKIQFQHPHKLMNF